MIVIYICVDTDHRYVLTTYCSSSSGDSVDLLRMTLCTTMVVSDMRIMNIAHGQYCLMKTCSTPLKCSNYSVTIARKMRNETFSHYPK